jgi:hypothetical protein
VGSWRATLEAVRDDLNVALEVSGMPDTRCVLDPADLNVPGVWVKMRALAAGTLNGDLCAVTLYCAVPDADTWATSLDSLQALVEVVTGIVPPMSEQVLVALPLPGGGTPVPAVRYDHDLILNTTP